jgi:hypothetical protein
MAKSKKEERQEQAESLREILVEMMCHIEDGGNRGLVKDRLEEWLQQFTTGKQRSERLAEALQLITRLRSSAQVLWTILNDLYK